MATKGRYANSKPVTLRGVRLSFANLEKPTSPPSHPDAKPKYNANFIMDPVQHKPDIQACKDAINGVIAELWPKGRPPKLKAIICFGKAGAETGLMVNKDNDPYDGYEDGKWFVAGKNAKRPTLAAKDGTILTPDQVDELLYSGCYVNASVEFMAADDANGQGVYCVLRGVRFVRDGEGFGANNAASLDELGGDDENGDDGFG